MSLVDVARDVAPQLREHADEGDRLRRMPDAAWKLLVESGLVRGMQPARWGGGEVPLAEFLDAVMEVGRASPCAGWVLGVMGVHPWQLGLFPEETQQEMWAGDARRIPSSSYAPTGKAERVDGGYRVSGRWSFSSGCDHGHGVMLGVATGSRTVESAELPELRSVLLMPGQYAIDDNWHTAGMRATGSKDIVVDGAFVPDHRTQSHLDYQLGLPLPGQERNDGPLYRMPWSVMFNFVLAASVLGAARGFVELWTELTSTRFSGLGVPMREEPLVRERLAQVTWRLDAAELKLRRDSAQVYDLVAAGGRCSPEQIAFIRWNANHGAEIVADAVMTLYRASSGRTAYIDHPLHRSFQDIQAMLGHTYLWADPHGLAYAGSKLGVELKIAGV
ncbi:acyl-CoA dehydrogenase family protein [Pseudonocardia acidicola]|uniref:Acyl-CoA dehydrogenase n=1 Tax=Pseudonocardia acidicola TaxID=2724939 RepID=A0ABX1SAU7_9PSEU|nr:acyl-CoA dehydrogenase family protein [Pseudonocardia acidicola]NMH97369.1 acyl-CoA dehydrogenase [Pseudonocardia acidicola]